MFKYILRLVWYLIKLTAIITVCIGLSIIAFFLAMDTANVYIIAQDGMAQRADVIFKLADSNSIIPFYTSEFIVNDELIKNDIYTDSIIRGYEYSLDVESLWCLPWEGTGSMIAVETVSKIDGEIPTNEYNEQGNIISLPLPPWERGRYNIKLIKTDGHWYIDEMILLEKLDPIPTTTPPPIVTSSPLPFGVTPEPHGIGSTLPEENLPYDIGHVILYGDAPALNVRNGAGTDYNKIGTLLEGDKVFIVDTSGGWYRITYDYDYAWVYAQYIELQEATE